MKLTGFSITPRNPNYAGSALLLIGTFSGTRIRRYENIFTIDLQAQKTLDFVEKGKLTAILTFFNATNSGTITSRARIINDFNFNDYWRGWMNAAIGSASATAFNRLR